MPEKKTTKNRVALYMRVSTIEQKPDLQINELRAYAECAELEIVEEYLDVAVSGKKQGRPQLDALMVAARSRAFDQVLVWKFDRFARSTKHLLSALEEFDHLGIGFVSFRDQIDTSSPMGRVMFTLVGAMAELESSLISERVTAGMEAAKAKGKHVGRPRMSRHTVTRIEKMARTTEMSIRQIQREIGGDVSRSSVGKIVKEARQAVL